MQRAVGKTRGHAAILEHRDAVEDDVLDADRHLVAVIAGALDDRMTRW